MRRLLPFVILFFSLLLDVSILPPLISHWAMPILLLDSVIVLGLLLGRTRGILYGMIAGVLLDILVCEPIGLMTMLFAVCGYLSGIAGRKFQRYLLTVAVTPILCLLFFEAATAFYALLAGATVTGVAAGRALARVGIQTALCQLLYLFYNFLLKPKWSRYAAR